MQMIRDFPKWWALLTCYVFKYHVNVTEGLEKIAEERIRVGNEEAGTRTFYQAYDKFQENQDKAQTRHLLEFAHRNICGRINQWHIIMIISTDIQNIPDKSGHIPLLLLTFILVIA